MRSLSATLSATGSAALSEAVKHRRTFGRRLVLFGLALMGFLYAFVQVTLGTGEADWPLLLAVVFVWWATVWTSLGSALAAALSDRLDGRAGALRALRARPVPPALYAGKLGGARPPDTRGCSGLGRGGRWRRAGGREPR